MHSEAKLASQLRRARAAATIVGYGGEGRPSEAMLSALREWDGGRGANSSVAGGRISIQRRRVSNAMIERGLAPDGRRRHAVECVVAQVRQWVKVRWAGFDTSSQAGAAWPESWIHRSQLTRDLWGQTRLRAKAKSRERRDAPEIQSDGSQRRCSPRLAGEQAREGMV